MILTFKEVIIMLEIKEIKEVEARSAHASN